MAKIFEPETVIAMNDRESSLMLKKMNHFSENTSNYSLSGKKIPLFALKPVQDGERAGTLADRLFRNETPMKVHLIELRSKEITNLVLQILRAIFYGPSAIIEKKVAKHTLGYTLKLRTIEAGSMAMAVIFVSPYQHRKIAADGFHLQAQYAVSADTYFAPEGGVTNINYEQMFNKLKEKAARILEQRTDLDKQTVKMWEDFVFRGCNLSPAVNNEEVTKKTNMRR
jgi:hypothetical protein